MMVWYMARVAITEYAAKRLFLGDAYTGVSCTPTTLKEAVTALTDGARYIIKIDVGIKKRGKQGLVRLNVPKAEVAAKAQELFDLGHDRCIVEEMFPHDEAIEQYVSLDLGREGTQVLHAKQGGIEIEEHSDQVEKSLIPLTETLSASPSLALEGVSLTALLHTMQQYHWSFCEINPFVVSRGTFVPLDMAVEIDSAKENKLPDWVAPHILHKKAVSPAEATVLELDARTHAALNLHVLNPNGSVLTLLSGGGASLVALDSLVSAGLSDDVINYSEYSGAPTREETAAYVTALLQVLFDSTPKNKVILIAGGVANFTDVRATFAGIVDAFTDVIEELQQQSVYVCVRRGGPNQEAGLAHLRDFLNEHQIPNDVHDPSLSLGTVGQLVKSHV